MSHVQPLFSSALVRVSDHLCTLGKGQRTPSPGGLPTHLKLVRRGCFYCHLGARTLLADSSIAYVHDAGGDYCSSHPSGAGDDCTLFELDPDLQAEMFGPRSAFDPTAFSLSPAVQVGHLAVYALLKRGGGDRLASQEMALDLLGRVARQAPMARPAGAGAARRRRLVDQAKAFVNQHIGENLDLAEVAREAACSPYHLMRQFRAETGLSLRGYRTRMRVAAVMDRLAHGDHDLSRLAYEFGFSSHSHLSSTFRQVLAARPSELRDRLAQGGLPSRRRSGKPSTATVHRAEPPPAGRPAPQPFHPDLLTG